MTRVALGHTGRKLTAGRPTVIIFLLINVAALARVVAAWSVVATTTLLVLAGLCWIAAFGLFEVQYSPVLRRRRIAPP
jgi:uncharacterized protein involved in response to NO